ncbi:MAG: hypothetical protein U9R25_14060 [Chloroflexota bacterium]|nr:hypothetical protein [Chloroflexota bacterium]
MSRSLRIILVLILIAGGSGLLPAFQAPLDAQEKPEQSIETVAPAALVGCDPDGVQSSGAIYRICMPPDWWWNGDLVIYAHGYVAYNEPLQIPEDQLCLDDGTCIFDIANVLGYGFATTSYATNGLAVKPGVQDVVDLIDIFAQQYGTPDRVFVVGVSEGGLVTTLVTEQYAGLVDGGLATCGPVGDFNVQTSYFGDFRAVFDYFFPGLVPGSPVNIPQPLIDNWDDFYQNVIQPVVFDPVNRAALQQLFSVTGAPFDVNDLAYSVDESLHDALWYNVFATNDAIGKLGGQPFHNLTREYTGSLDDAALNAGVARFGADPAAIAEITAHYQTSGQLSVPLVTMHTLRDQQVPYYHEGIYRLKTLSTGSAFRHINIPIDRYGHCEFTTVEAIVAFAIMIFMATGESLDQVAVQKLLPEKTDQARFTEQFRQVQAEFLNQKQ